MSSASMQNLRFAVLGSHHEHLGWTEGRRSKCGDPILVGARELGALKYNVTEADIVVDYVGLRTGPVHLDVASNMPVPKLHEEEAKVYIKAPDATEPAYIQDMRQTMTKQGGLIADLEKRMRSMEEARQRQTQLALHCLLDKSREELVGGVLSEEQRRTWNTQLSTGRVLLPEGVTYKAALLTRFGEGSQQQAGNVAAHEFSKALLADAVMSLPGRSSVLFRQLFKLCFKETVDDFLLADVPEDDAEADDV